MKLQEYINTLSWDEQKELINQLVSHPENLKRGDNVIIVKGPMVKITSGVFDEETEEIENQEKNGQVFNIKACHYPFVLAKQIETSELIIIDLRSYKLQQVSKEYLKVYRKEMKLLREKVEEKPQETLFGMPVIDPSELTFVPTDPPEDDDQEDEEGTE